MFCFALVLFVSQNFCMSPKETEEVSVTETLELSKRRTEHGEPQPTRNLERFSGARSASAGLGRNLNVWQRLTIGLGGRRNKLNKIQFSAFATPSALYPSLLAQAQTAKLEGLKLAGRAPLPSWLGSAPLPLSKA